MDRPIDSSWLYRIVALGSFVFALVLLFAAIIVYFTIGWFVPLVFVAGAFVAGVTSVIFVILYCVHIL